MNIVSSVTRFAAVSLCMGVGALANACASAAPPPENPSVSPSEPPTPTPTPGDAPTVARPDPSTTAIAPPAPAEPARDAHTEDASAKGGIPGANLSIGSINADGVLIEKLSCKADGLGLLGAMTIAGTLAKQRAALVACGLSTPIPVRWTIEHGAVKDAHADSGDTKRDACVVRALKGVRSVNDVICEAKLGVK